MSSVTLYKGAHRLSMALASKTPISRRAVPCGRRDEQCAVAEVLWLTGLCNGRGAMAEVQWQGLLWQGCCGRGAVRLLCKAGGRGPHHG